MTEGSIFKLVKRHKRLMIVDSNENIIYCPPDFLRPVTNRSDYDPLLEDLAEFGEIKGRTLTEFETKFNPRLWASRKKHGPK